MATPCFYRFIEKMQTYNSFNELAAANMQSMPSPMSMFNHNMTADKVKRIAGTRPAELSDAELQFAVKDTQEDYDADQRRGESSSGGRLHKRLLQELQRRGGDSDGGNVSQLPQPAAQKSTPTPKIQATNPEAQRVLEAAASGQFPTDRGDLMNIVSLVRASGNKMPDDLRQKLLAGAKERMKA